MPLSPMKRSMIPRVGCGQGELMARLAGAAATSGYLPWSARCRRFTPDVHLWLMPRLSPRP